MSSKKEFWISASLINLAVVAFLGFVLRSKFHFSIPFINYRYFLSAHSHFAFGGWVTLILMTLFINQVLPAERSSKKVYQGILWGIQLSAWGMVLSFPFEGYAAFSIVFSTLFIFATFAFAWVFISDLRKSSRQQSVNLLAIAAVLCLVISSIGPFTLAYILATKTRDAILYRDAVYTYLHFQYNGFFTLSAFALLLNHVLPTISNKGKTNSYVFALLLVAAVVPSLFLSLLWHPGAGWFRVVAVIGCVFILLSLVWFTRALTAAKTWAGHLHPVARTLLLLSMASFVLKMLFHTGTIIPSLGNAVYGDRPVIIGFLHLVFLAFITFYILSNLVQAGAFTMHWKFTQIAIITFVLGVLFSEALLMLQGLGVLLNITSSLYSLLLWISSILLFTGALLMAVARLQHRSNTPVPDIKKVTL